MKAFRFLVCAVFVMCLSMASSFAWDGYDYEKGTYIEIEKENLVREGEDIEVFDYSDGLYHDVSVESMSPSGSSVEIEVHDYETGENRVFDMEE